MNILFHSPSNTIGGAELSMLATIKYLSQKGFNIYVTLPASKNKKYEELLRPHIERIFYVKPMLCHRSTKMQSLYNRILTYLYACYKSGGWHFRPVYKIFRIIKKHKIHIVHTNTLHSVDGALAAKCAGVIHVQHIREITGRTRESIISLFFQEHKWFPGFANWLNDAIICNSLYTLQKSKPYFPIEKMSVIYNPISDNYFKKEITPKENYIIGCVANLTADWKNHLYVLQVASKLKQHNITFHFYGSVPLVYNQYFSNLKDSVSKYGLTNKVFFAGSCEPEMIYNSIDILLHPYPFEPFGRIYLEAMAACVPVLAVEGGGASELIHNKKTGFLFGINDFQACANQITALLNDPDLYYSITREASIFSESFRSERLLIDLEKLYTTLLRPDADGKH